MLTKDLKIRMGQAETKDGPVQLMLLPKMANRHGIIAGATGTGKTVSMKVMAESFSDMGVPVFFADVKGDLTGTVLPGADSEDMQARIRHFGLEEEFSYTGYPVRFFDIFGEKGIPVRVTVSSLGPLLLARLLGLTEVQKGVLDIVFKVADEHGLLLLDLKDLRALLSYVGENAREFTLTYGQISSASVGAIQRALLAFENEGGECLFGEPQLDVSDFMQTTAEGKGIISILESTRLFRSPLIYSTFLLWMLTEFYEKLPEIGDPDKPRLVFFFDEAHVLFEGASKALVLKIEQMIRLVRSKGVGIYFVTQDPSDVPDSVLAQLSNRIQHALRAYTPGEQKKLKAAAKAFRVNPDFDTEEALLRLGTGEALVSFLDEKGIPEVVQYARILPPQSYIGPADDTVVNAVIAGDLLYTKYSETVDRESAYEILEKARAELAQMKEEEKAKKEAEKAAKAAAKRPSQSTAKKMADSAASSVARSVSTNIVNSLTGGKTTSLPTIARRAASNALSSVMRTEMKSFVRGLFGNKK